MLNPFLLNLFLALIYVALLGSVTFLDFVIGFGVGFLLLLLINRTSETPSYLTRVVRLFSFSAYFIAILVKANWQVAREVITPGLGCQPRIIRYPVPGLTAIETTTLANAISLTPGTLSADIDEETQTLYIHCMYGKDRDAAVAELDDLKNRLLHQVFGHKRAI